MLNSSSSDAMPFDQFGDDDARITARVGCRMDCQLHVNFAHVKPIIGRHGGVGVPYGVLCEYEELISL